MVIQKPEEEPPTNIKKPLKEVMEFIISFVMTTFILGFLILLAKLVKK